MEVVSSSSRGGGGGINSNTPGWPSQSGSDRTVTGAAAEHKSVFFSPYLQPGIRFKGTQTVRKPQNSKADDWEVTVIIEGIDASKGIVFGSMEASNGPSLTEAVLTFWQGEVIDNVHNFFLSAGPSSASSSSSSSSGANYLSELLSLSSTFAIELLHWAKIPAFRPFRKHVATYADEHADGNQKAESSATIAKLLSDSQHVFMRLRELYFVKPVAQQSQTITGSYFICLDRYDGHVMGVYVNNNATPFPRAMADQKLTLHPHVATSTYSFR